MEVGQAQAEELQSSLNDSTTPDATRSTLHHHALGGLYLHAQSPIEESLRRFACLELPFGSFGAMLSVLVSCRDQDFE